MSGYAKNPMFWEKDAPRVMGDLLARPRATHLGHMAVGSRPTHMSALVGSSILEAGCGTGYFARMIMKEIKACEAEEDDLVRRIEKGIANATYYPGFKLTPTVEVEGEGGYGYLPDEERRLAALKKDLVRREKTSVVAYDNNPAMLALAEKEEEKKPFGIRYFEKDVAMKWKRFDPKFELTPPTVRLPFYNRECFDLIFCVGVMIHWKSDSIRNFLEAAWEALYESGRLVVSVTHPSLFLPSSPSRSGNPCWVEHSLNERRPYNPKFSDSNPWGGVSFVEKYRDVNGNVFESEVFNHSFENYYGYLSKHFNIKYVQELYVEQRHLVHESWGKEWGYPAFLQFICGPKPKPPDSRVLRL